MGVDGDPSQIDGLLVLKQGRWLRRPDEVMVGTTLAREKHLAVGDPLRLSGRTFTIVGIGNSGARRLGPRATPIWTIKRFGSDRVRPTP